MTNIMPKSIRGRITLMAAIATAIAMILIVMAMGLAARAILEDAIAESLQERLDQARNAVSAGDYDLVIDLAGNEIMQVIDVNGNVVAGSRNARGLAAIDDGDEVEKDELEFELEQAKPEDAAEPHDGLDSADANGDAGNAARSKPSSAPAGSGSNSHANTNGNDRSGEDDDDHEDDKADGDDRRNGDSDDDEDDNDDGDDDGDDGKSAKASKSSSSRRAKSAVSLNWPFFQAIAWADEVPSRGAPDDVAIDAASILGKEGPYLILKEQVDSPDGPMTIVAVTSLSQATQSAMQMMWLLAAIMIVVLAATIALTWILTGRTLRPVETMRAKAASISAENLSERIAVPDGDEDLAPLAETLNEMLVRIERSLEQERRFISDASHELKSPISATSIILDTLRSHPDDADLAKAVDDLTNENDRMASVVADMLTLTRYDEGRLNCKPEPIDVMDVILEETMSLGARTDIEIDVTNVQPVICHADGGLLRHVLRNLLDNAERYATSLVKVDCEHGIEDAVIIQISDDGCGIAPEDRERAFDRFVCLDERSGTGLGLSVAHTIIAAHDGTLEFVDPVLGGATARITLQSE